MPSGLSFQASRKDLPVHLVGGRTLPLIYFYVQGDRIATFLEISAEQRIENLT